MGDNLLIIGLSSHDEGNTYQPGNWLEADGDLQWGQSAKKLNVQLLKDDCNKSENVSFEKSFTVK